MNSTAVSQPQEAGSPDNPSRPKRYIPDRHERRQKARQAQRKLWQLLKDSRPGVQEVREQVLVIWALFPENDKTELAQEIRLDVIELLQANSNPTIKALASPTILYGSFGCVVSKQ